MATRTRSAGGSIAIQYEDFRPKSEFKEEEGANILLLHLPNFQKEQITVTYVHSSRVIRVVGARPITNGNGMRFNEAFTVPQHFDVTNIQGRFQNGLLTITMPKTTITQPKLSSTTSSIGKEENELKKESPQVEETGKKEMDERNEKPKEALFGQEDISNNKRKEALLGDQSEEESSKKRKEGIASTTSEIIKKKQPKEDLFAEKVKGVKNRVKGFAMEMSSEEKKSLVNIGVAVFVIAALGAYISYRYGSSSGDSSKE
ncbi:hypothetical protein JCGZ_12842 [Jatropha curcas]|uniref:SHSP domain-containing protein n=1 Tax=Jatropha curcas TaxID=180498 RepID=A0A067KH18_JATCU|nr:hypothetical protein JCGZ_12842 [Jatropha curcas]